MRFNLVRCLVGGVMVAFWVLVFLPSANASTIIQSPAYLGLTNGLVGFWSFSESKISGTSVQDESGNGNTGTLTNGPTKTIGKIGQGLGFDGSNDYVNTSSTMNFGSKIITVSFWLYWNAFANNDSLAMELSTNYNNNDGSFLIDPNSAAGSFELNIQDGSTPQLYRQETFTRPSAQTWHHYTFVFDNSTTAGDITVYVDSVLQSTTIGTNNKDQTSDFRTDTLYFMSRAGSSLFGAGKLDDVRIYNRALSPDEIKRLYRIGASTKINTSINTGNISQGLVGFWDFAEKNMGTTSALDLSGLGNTGWLINGVQRTIGKIGQGMSFDGADDVINVGSPASLDNLGPMSVAVWAYPKSTGEGGFGRFVGKDGSITSNGSWLLIFNSATSPLQFGKESGAIDLFRNGATTIEMNRWHHIVATWDGTTNATGIRIYIDGVESAYGTEGNGISIVSDAANDLLIGNRPAGDRTFDGLIDDVRVYNRALSPDEIKRLYRIGASTKINTSINTGTISQGLVGFWDFSEKNMGTTSVSDLSGNGNTGWLINGPQRAIGKIGQGMSFDGSDDYVSVTDNATLRPGTSPWTYSIWFWAANANQAGNLITKRETVSPFNQIGLLIADCTTNANAGKRIQALTIGTDAALDVNWFCTSNDIVDGRWHHAVFVRPASGDLLIYVDGVNQAKTEIRDSNTEPQNINNTSPVVVGQNNASALFFKGLLDDVRIYNRALSADEIKRLYNVGR